MVVTSWDFNERMKPLMNSLCGLWTTPWMTDVPDVFVFCTSHLSPWSIRPSTECCERRNLKQRCRWRVTYLTGSWGGRCFSELLNLVSDGEGQPPPAPCCAAVLRMFTSEVQTEGRRSDTWADSTAAPASRLLHTRTQTGRAENLPVLSSTLACFCVKRAV